MAIEATELEEMRDALIRARAKGVRELQMNGERVRYGSDAEMAAAIAALDRRLASPTRVRTVAFKTSKGV
ncbi:phage head-tail joining protein [Chachezhania sediminis]|uniref:phage head-tail joining protein n=1 Tax=Chachezhania sediminis TaxID=2599291 RepID=UPI00131EA949|nr:hypothetical protein [Chachezhania sediminis]